MCLKLIHQGFLQNYEKYEKMLATSKFHFIPIINVDGANLVEEKWNTEHKILNKRKNMNPEYLAIVARKILGLTLIETMEQIGLLREQKIRLNYVVTFGQVIHLSLNQKPKL